MIFIDLLIILLMILASAFFVASEFALIRVRTSRLLEIINLNENKKEVQRAEMVIRIKENINDYLGACQVGITITSIVIGGLGQSLFSGLFVSLFKIARVPAFIQVSLAIILAYIFLTYIHVIFGDLLPKSVSIAKTEEIALAVAKPLDVFYRIARPVINVMNGSTNLIGRILRLPVKSEEEEAPSQGELLYIAGESLRSGKINLEEHTFVEKVFDFDDTLSSEIMKNRTEIYAINNTESVSSALEKLTDVEYTRVPVIRNNNKDEIVGYVRQQDLIREKLRGNEDLGTVLQAPVIALEQLKIKELFKLMRNSHKHLAILVDEHGGTSGLVTIEDIIEEIFGDIQDESDTDEKKPITLKENQILVDGSTELEAVEEMFDEEIPEFKDIELDTISGFLIDLYPEILSDQDFTKIYKISDDYTAKIRSMSGNRIDDMIITKEKA